MAASIPVPRLQRRALAAVARRLELPLLYCTELVPLLRFRNAAWTGYTSDPFTLLYDSSRILHGQVPYRDFFQFVAPGTLWLEAAWMAVFGVDAAGPQVLLVLVLAFLGVGLYVLAAHATGRRPLALFAPAFVLLTLPAHFPWPYHHWYGVTAMVAALLAISAWLRRGRAGWLVVAGVACGATGLFVQTYGVAIVLGLTAFLMVQARSWRAVARSGASFAAGLCLALAPVLAYFEAVGGLGRLIYDTLLWPPSHYMPINEYPFAGNIGDWLRWGIAQTTPGPVHGIAGPSSSRLAASLYTGLSGAAAFLLPLLGAGLGALVVLRSVGLRLLGRPAPESAATSLLTACALVAIASLALAIRVRADMIHLVWSTILTYPVLLGRAARLRRPAADRLVAVVLGTLVAASAAWFMTLTTRSGISSIDEVASRDPLPSMVRARTAPGDEIAFIGYGGVVYFYGRPAAIGHTLVLPMDDYTTAAEVDQVRREILLRRPRLVVFGVGISCDPGPGPAGCLFPLPEDYRGAGGSAMPDRLVADNATWWIYTRRAR